MAYSIYLSNQSPTRNVCGMTQQEAWSGRKPSVSHLKVLKSITHFHILDEKRAKLDEKIEKFIFVGYDQS